jgi:RNA recognition motif-containing protein
MVDLRIQGIDTKNTMSNKLYVGGLAWATTNESLGSAFAAAGAVVSAQVIVDRMSGRSKGFGFVEMADAAGAQAAIAMWHEKELDGRLITVNEARPMEDRPPRPAGGGYGARPPRRDDGFGGGSSRGGYGSSDASTGNRW